MFLPDNGNNRVLRWKNASSIAGAGANADGVLGQPDFGSSSPNTTMTSMSSPYGVHVDPTGTLWVADTLNHRILRFLDAINKPNGSAADSVLGQPDFNNRTILPPSPTTLYRPGQMVWFNSQLFVADTYNNRVVQPSLSCVLSFVFSTKKALVSIYCNRGGQKWRGSLSRVHATQPHQQHIPSTHSIQWVPSDGIACRWTGESLGSRYVQQSSSDL